MTGEEREFGMASYIFALNCTLGPDGRVKGVILHCNFAPACLLINQGGGKCRKSAASYAKQETLGRCGFGVVVGVVVDVMVSVVVGVAVSVGVGIVVSVVVDVVLVLCWSCG